MCAIDRTFCWGLTPNNSLLYTEIVFSKLFIQLEKIPFNNLFVIFILFFLYKNAHFLWLTKALLVN